MGTINFIVNTKIANVSQSATINAGSVVNIRPRNNVKVLGRATPIGDFTTNFAAAGNQNFDPDLVDQS